MSWFWKRQETTTDNELTNAIREAKQLDPKLSYIITVRRGAVAPCVLHRLDLKRLGINAVIIETYLDPHDAMAVYKLEPPQEPQ